MICRVVEGSDEGSYVCLLFSALQWGASATVIRAGTLKGGAWRQISLEMLLAAVQGGNRQEEAAFRLPEARRLPPPAPQAPAANKAAAPHLDEKNDERSFWV